MNIWTLGRGNNRWMEKLHFALTINHYYVYYIMKDRVCGGNVVCMEVITTVLKSSVDP